MDLSPAKREILEAILLLGKAAKAAEVAKEINQKTPTVQMHLIGLTRAGYASSPEKGQYAITEQGKKALNLPEVTKEKAEAILKPVPSDSAFYFYAGIGNPLNVSAHSLQDFCDKITTVTSDCAEFHMNRGDFEAWFTYLGDEELAKKTGLLKQRKLSGEDLRNKLLSVVQDRCIALSTIAGQTAQP
ncbi:MAG: hypothetical protein ACE14S_07585 [Candidatus Bathyarchaeia archaeon]